MPDKSEAEESFEDINRSLYKQGMTDGLPVTPPTEERVAEMLRGTDFDRDHIIGRLGNNDNPLTVEDLASNAVMAGCIPPYMPVLEAGAKALADPESNSIQSSVSTGSWSYQWIVNGPVQEKLNIESGAGAFGPSFHANQTIPRALGIAYRNTAKIYPGEKDMGVMGNPHKFYFLAGENEADSPWEPHHVTQGFDTEDSTISLTTPNGWLQWYPGPGGNNAETIVQKMIENTPEFMRARSGDDLNVTITHFINPYNAEELEKANLSKEEIKEYMVANSTVNSTSSGGLSRSSGDGPKLPPRQGKQYHDTDAINIVSMGGPGRWNAIAGTSIGGPVTKQIEFPNNWDDLVAEYVIEHDWVPSEGFYE